MKAHNLLVNKSSACLTHNGDSINGYRQKKQKKKRREGRWVGETEETRGEKKGRGSRGNNRRRHENKSLSSLM